MKATIDIPDALYKRVRIRAIERGKTLKQIVLASLERELEAMASSGPTQPESFFQKRRLLPEFARREAEGGCKPGPADRDVTELISQDRDGR
ncbi:MAG: hypothetical protein NTW21_01870 [Verrucomicrobia bacterium]|nr:hypothetical protein [Verrucomicrobiota bacterium]